MPVMDRQGRWFAESDVDPCRKPGEQGGRRLDGGRLRRTGSGVWDGDDAAYGGRPCALASVAPRRAGRILGRKRVPNDCIDPWPPFSRWRDQGGRSVWRNSVQRRHGSSTDGRESGSVVTPNGPMNGSS